MAEVIKLPLTLPQHRHTLTQTQTHTPYSPPTDPPSFSSLRFCFDQKSQTAAFFPRHSQTVWAEDRRGYIHSLTSLWTHTWRVRDDAGRAAPRRCLFGSAGRGHREVVNLRGRSVTESDRGGRLESIREQFGHTVGFKSRLGPVESRLRGNWTMSLILENEKNQMFSFWWHMQTWQACLKD